MAVKDRKYRFEVGHGLEGALPDSLLGTIGRRYLVPNFRKGDYGAGLSRAIEVVSKIILEQKDGKVTKTVFQKYFPDEDGQWNIPGCPDVLVIDSAFLHFRSLPSGKK